MKYKYIIFEIRNGNMWEHKENVPRSNIELNYGLGSSTHLLHLQSKLMQEKWNVKIEQKRKMND